MLHVNDLGGEEAISAAEHSIIRRIATITTELSFWKLSSRSRMTAPVGQSQTTLTCTCAARPTARRFGNHSAVGADFFSRTVSTV